MSTESIPITTRIVVDEMFRFPPGHDKIHIYAYKNRYPQAWGARAFHGGLIIWSLDHQHRKRRYHRSVPNYCWVYGDTFLVKTST